jgi:hypothetical protein
MIPCDSIRKVNNNASNISTSTRRKSSKNSPEVIATVPVHRDLANQPCTILLTFPSTPVSHSGLPYCAVVKIATSLTSAPPRPGKLITNTQSLHFCGSISRKVQGLNCYREKRYVRVQSLPKRSFSLAETSCTPVFPMTIAAKRVSTYVISLRVGVERVY